MKGVHHVTVITWVKQVGEMTRVEGENTRLRHDLAHLHRKTPCYSKSVDMLAHSVRWLLHYRD